MVIKSTKKKVIKMAIVTGQKRTFYSNICMALFLNVHVFTHTQRIQNTRTLRGALQIIYIYVLKWIYIYIMHTQL